jgi:hypothetical protein
MAPCKKRFREVVPAVRHLCSQSRTLDQESQPNASAKCRDTVRKDNHRRSRSLPTKRPRKPNLLLAMDYFTKWPEAYAIPHHEASPVAEALVTNFSCPFGIPRELYSEQGRDFESRLIQGVLQLLGTSGTRTLHTQLDQMVDATSKRTGTQDYP